MLAGRLAWQAADSQPWLGTPRNLGKATPLQPYRDWSMWSNREWLQWTWPGPEWPRLPACVPRAAVVWPLAAPTAATTEPPQTCNGGRATFDPRHRQIQYSIRISSQIFLSFWYFHLKKSRRDCCRIGCSVIRGIHSSFLSVRFLFLLTVSFVSSSFCSLPSLICLARSGLDSSYRRRSFSSSPRTIRYFDVRVLRISCWSPQQLFWVARLVSHSPALLDIDLVPRANSASSQKTDIFWFARPAFST